MGKRHRGPLRKRWRDCVHEGRPTIFWGCFARPGTFVSMIDIHGDVLSVQAN